MEVAEDSLWSIPSQAKQSWKCHGQGKQSGFEKKKNVQRNKDRKKGKDYRIFFVKGDKYLKSKGRES